MGVVFLIGGLYCDMKSDIFSFFVLEVARTLLGTSASLVVTSALLVVTRTLRTGLLALLLGARTLLGCLEVHRG